MLRAMLRCGALLRDVIDGATLARRCLRERALLLCLRARVMLRRR